MSDAALPRILADPGSAAIYRALLAELDRLGGCDLRYRKAAVQALRPDGTGILAAHPDPTGLIVTLILGEPIGSPRMLSCQPLSDHSWQHRLHLADASGVDDELRTWLALAYRRP